jgi:hypothetical protein
VKIFIEVCVLFHNLLVEVDKRIRKTLSYTAKPYEIYRVEQNLILYTISDRIGVLSGLSWLRIEAGGGHL